MSAIEGDSVERLNLHEATTAVLEECRMVLPGIQALFGFQLIAVFNRTFPQLLSAREQIAHMIALVMSALAVAMVMAPAAYHRQVHPESVSKTHLRFSSWMLTLGMLPLMLAILIDVYLVTRVITDNVPIAACVTALETCVFLTLWVILPRVRHYLRKGRLL
jgi:hypothetical protein